MFSRRRRRRRSTGCGGRIGMTFVGYFRPPHGSRTRNFTRRLEPEMDQVQLVAMGIGRYKQISISNPVRDQLYHERHVSTPFHASS